MLSDDVVKDQISAKVEDGMLDFQTQFPSRFTAEKM